MPQFQVVDWGPSPEAVAAANFGKGFSDSLKRARDQQRQTDMLSEILNPRDSHPEFTPPFFPQPQNAQNSMKGPSYLGPQEGAPDNITPALQSAQNSPAALAQQGIVSGQNPQTGKLNRVTPEKMAKLQIIAPDLAKALQPVYESQSSKEKEQTKSDVKRSGDFLSKIDQIREGIPRKELSLRQIDDAIASRGNLDFLKDQLASITGQEGLRSAKGAQLLSATKEFFLADLSSIPGVRANQFLERALSSAMTDPSRIQEANEMVAAGMRSNLKLDKIKSEITGQVEDYYRNTLGHIPASISKDVDKQLAPYAQQIQDEWANEVQHIQESHDPKIERFLEVQNDPYKRKRAAKNIQLKKAIPGSVLDETMGMILLDKYGDNEEKAMEAAKKLGYKLPGE